jgi:hypothetical protein
MEAEAILNAGSGTPLCEPRLNESKQSVQARHSGAYSSAALETAAFTMFIYPRMIGSAAEIDDHMNRGRNHTHTGVAMPLRHMNRPQS